MLLGKREDALEFFHRSEEIQERLQEKELSEEEPLKEN